jgi:transcription termination factor Rho
MPIVKSLSTSSQTSESFLEIGDKGFGFLRSSAKNYAPSSQDTFVSADVIRQYSLRPGLSLKGRTQPRQKGGMQLLSIESVNDQPLEKYRSVLPFDKLTTVHPLERIRLETTPDSISMRVLDLLAPIGKGQRGLLVSPPRSGKTTLLKQIANSVVKNHPEIYLIVLLVDERPEEVTDFKREVKGEVAASSNDMDMPNHIRISLMTIERAKRMVEFGKDVVILLDSITRVARVFNNASANSGRTMTGGLDARAMEQPRRMFAAARKTEEAGSLTIIATALIETGSRMDELIFQEFKGTGNMELVLDRKIAEQRIWPAVDIFQSGTRKEELLIPAKDLEKTAYIRRGLSGLNPPNAMARVVEGLTKFPTNAKLLAQIK